MPREDKYAGVRGYLNVLFYPENAVMVRNCIFLRDVAGEHGRFSNIYPDKLSEHLRKKGLRRTYRLRTVLDLLGLESKKATMGEESRKLLTEATEYAIGEEVIGKQTPYAQVLIFPNDKRRIGIVREKLLEYLEESKIESVIRDAVDKGGKELVRLEKLKKEYERTIETKIKRTSDEMGKDLVSLKHIRDRVIGKQ